MDPSPPTLNIRNPRQSFWGHPQNLSCSPPLQVQLWGGSTDMTQPPSGLPWGLVPRMGGSYLALSLPPGPFPPTEEKMQVPSSSKDAPERLQEWPRSIERRARLPSPQCLGARRGAELVYKGLKDTGSFRNLLSPTPAYCCLRPKRGWGWGALEKPGSGGWGQTWETTAGLRTHATTAGRWGQWAALKST